MTDEKEMLFLHRILRYFDRNQGGGERVDSIGGHGTRRNRDETLWPGPPDLPRCVHSGLKAAVATGSLEQIQEADWFQYRYLSLDRPNLQFVAKECSTEMTEPCQRHLSLVKKAAR